MRLFPQKKLITLFVYREKNEKNIIKRTVIFLPGAFSLELPVIDMLILIQSDAVEMMSIFLKIN